MSTSNRTDGPPSAPPDRGVREEQVEYGFIGKLQALKYDIFQPAEMVEDNKRLFRQILAAFLERHRFALPALQQAGATAAAGGVAA